MAFRSQRAPINLTVGAYKSRMRRILHLVVHPRNEASMAAARMDGCARPQQTRPRRSTNTQSKPLLTGVVLIRRG
jgi:hypothetical protein